MAATSQERMDPPASVRPTAAALAIVAALAVALTGCGRLDRDAVQTEIQNVESAAAEGALVAREVQRGRTFRSFVVIRTAELHKQAMNASDALQETPTESGLDSSARRGAALGDHVRELLERLHERPTDRTLGRSVHDGLDKLASEAGDLADTL
jgi:hypothetical protein